MIDFPQDMVAKKWQYDGPDFTFQNSQCPLLLKASDVDYYKNTLQIHILIETHFSLEGLSASNFS